MHIAEKRNRNIS